MFRRSLTDLFSLFLFETPTVPTATAPPAPAPAATVPPATEPAKPAEETVPYDRFTKVNEQLQELKTQNEALQAKVTESERAGLGELERLKAELADAQTRIATTEQERDQIRTAAEETAKTGWIREAARDLKFHDPEDAVLRIKLEDVQTEAGAKSAVEALARNESLKHLVQSEEKPKTGGDLLTAVLNGEKPKEAEKADQVIDADKINSMTADELARLQESDPDLYARSLRAAAASAE